uniref:Tripartite motif containing 66 n=1 Tax=Gasterosteus aculeatus TaxID=69293 RepID=G3PSR2_GASAC
VFQNCSECSVPTLAQSLCTLCNKWLCYQCTDVHQHQRATTTYHYTDMHKQQRPSPGSYPCSLLMCHAHRQEPLELFCESCDLLCCSSCHLSSHKNHRVVQIGNALQDQQWLFESLMVQVDERRSAVENNAKQLEERLHGVKIAHRKAENQIKMAKMIMMNELNKRANLLIEQLEKISEDFQHRLEDHLQGAIEICGQLDHVQKFITWATTHHCRGPVLFSRALMSLQMQQLLESSLHSDSWSPVRIKFNWDASYWTKQISSLVAQPIASRWTKLLMLHAISAGQLNVEGGDSIYPRGLPCSSILRPQPINRLALPSVCHRGRELGCGYQNCCEPQLCCVHGIPSAPDPSRPDKGQLEAVLHNSSCVRPALFSASLHQNQQLQRCWDPDNSLQCPPPSSPVSVTGPIQTQPQTEPYLQRPHQRDVLSDSRAQPGAEHRMPGRRQRTLSTNAPLQQQVGHAAADRDAMNDENWEEKCRVEEAPGQAAVVESRALADGELQRDRREQSSVQQEQQQLRVAPAAELRRELQRNSPAVTLRDHRDGRFCHVSMASNKTTSPIYMHLLKPTMYESESGLFSVQRSNTCSDGATEMCFCFYEERTLRKQRAGLTITAELFLAMHPKIRRAPLVIITLKATLKGSGRHIITSPKSQGAYVQTQDELFLLPVKSPKTTWASFMYLKSFQKEGLSFLVFSPPHSKSCIRFPSGEDQQIICYSSLIKSSLSNCPPEHKSHECVSDVQSSRLGPALVCRGRDRRSQSIPPELAAPSTSPYSERPPGCAQSPRAVAETKVTLHQNIIKVHLSCQKELRSFGVLQSNSLRQTQSRKMNMNITLIKGTEKLSSSQSNRDVQKDSGRPRVPVVCLERLKILVSQLPPHGRRQSDPLPASGTEKSEAPPQQRAGRDARPEADPDPQLYSDASPDSPRNAESSSESDREAQSFAEADQDCPEMESEDFCAVCLIGGDLLCCDRCPKVFHLSCHIPSLLSFPSGDWLCSLCRDVMQPEVEYDCENKRTSGGHTPAHGLPVCDQRKCERLTLLILSNVLSAPFHEPVSPLARHYYQIIKRPMDLSVIRAKLNKRNTQHYISTEEFVADVYLMFRNCAKFNYPDSEVAQAGRNLEMFFISNLKEVFPDRVFPAAQADSDSDEYDEAYRAAESGFPWPERREQCLRKRKRRPSLKS